MPNDPHMHMEMSESRDLRLDIILNCCILMLAYNTYNNLTIKAEVNLLLYYCFFFFTFFITKITLTQDIPTHLLPSYPL